MIYVYNEFEYCLNNIVSKVSKSFEYRMLDLNTFFKFETKNKDACLFALRRREYRFDLF